MRRWISLILFIVSIVLLSISIYSLMGMFREYKQADELNERLQQIHDTAAQPDESETAPTPRATSKPFVTPAPDETPAADSEEETADQSSPVREVDTGLLALHEENPDCIYWLTIPDITRPTANPMWSSLPGWSAWISPNPSACPMTGMS